MTYEQINKIALKIVDTGVICVVIYLLSWWAYSDIWGFLICVLPIALFIGFFLLVFWAAVMSIDKQWDKCWDKEEQKKETKELSCDLFQPHSEK